MKGITAGTGPSVRQQQAEQGHDSGSSVDTGRQLQTMQQQGYSGMALIRATPNSLASKAGGTVHAIQSRGRV